MATTQKVVAVLRKAGGEISKYHRSGMIRGWGESTRGYEVRRYGDGPVRVTHTEGSTGRRTETPERRDAALSKAAEALRAAGLDVAEAGTEFTRWLEVR